MLKVLFGKELPNTVHDTGLLFRQTYDESWLSDHFVRRLIKSIDKSDVNGQCIISPILGQIPPEYLSGGCKAMIMLYKGVYEEYDRHFDMTYMGRNCEEWLYQISQMKDLEICCTTQDNTFEGKDVSGVSLNSGKEFHNWQEFINLLIHDGV